MRSGPTYPCATTRWASSPSFPSRPSRARRRSCATYVCPSACLVCIVRVRVCVCVCVCVCVRLAFHACVQLQISSIVFNPSTSTFSLPKGVTVYTHNQTNAGFDAFSYGDIATLLVWLEVRHSTHVPPFCWRACGVVCSVERRVLAEGRCAWCGLAC